MARVNPDLMRLALAELIEHEFEVDVTVQGKRLIVEGDDGPIVILVTKGTDEARRRELATQGRAVAGMRPAPLDGPARSE